MNATGNILVTQNETTNGSGVQEKYEWVGGRIVQVSLSFFNALKDRSEVSTEPGSKFSVGPFDLRVIEYVLATDLIFAIKCNGIDNKLLYGFHYCRLKLVGFYYKLLRFAKRNNCLDTKEGKIMRWQDLCLPWRVMKK